MSCSEVEIVREFTYLGDGESAGRESEAALTARILFGSVTLMDCGEILFGKSFSLRLKRAVYEIYVRTAILYESEA